MALPPTDQSAHEEGSLQCSNTYAAEIGAPKLLLGHNQPQLLKPCCDLVVTYYVMQPVTIFNSLGTRTNNWKKKKLGKYLKGLKHVLWT